VLSLLFVGLGIVGNLPGGFLYAFTPASSRRRAAPSQSARREAAPLAPPPKI